MIPEWVRWAVLVLGIAILVVFWNTSDTRLRLRFRKRSGSPDGYYEYDDGLHGFKGGIARFKLLLLGIALILTAIFWSTLRPYLDWLVPG